jgi:hypothetical protein
MIETPFDQMMTSMNIQGLLFLVKASLVLGFFIYFVFAAVAVVQIKRMFQTVDTGGEVLFTTIGWGHLILSGLALLWAIVVI